MPTTGAAGPEDAARPAESQGLFGEAPDPPSHTRDRAKEALWDKVGHRMPTRKVVARYAPSPPAPTAQDVVD